MYNVLQPIIFCSRDYAAYPAQDVTTGIDQKTSITKYPVQIFRSPTRTIHEVIIIIKYNNGNTSLQGLKVIALWRVAYHNLSSVTVIVTEGKIKGKIKIITDSRDTFSYFFFLPITKLLFSFNKGKKRFLIEQQYYMCIFYYFINHENTLLENVDKILNMSTFPSVEGSPQFTDSKCTGRINESTCHRDATTQVMMLQYS